MNGLYPAEPAMEAGFLHFTAMALQFSASSNSRAGVTEINGYQDLRNRFGALIHVMVPAKNGDKVNQTLYLHPYAPISFI